MRSFFVLLLLAALPLWAEPEKNATEITCDGEMTFDAKAGEIVFVENVKITSAEFTLTTDRLTVYLKKLGKGEKPDAAGVLDRIVAEGNVVISQERADGKTGETTLYAGKAEKAEYRADTGEVTLSGWPQISQGANLQKAARADTVMIVDREGNFRAKGPTRAVIQTDKMDLQQPRKKS